MLLPWKPESISKDIKEHLNELQYMENGIVKKNIMNAW